MGGESYVLWLGTGSNADRTDPRGPERIRFSADLCGPARTRHYLTCTDFVTLFIVCDTFYRMAKPACVGVLCDLAHTRIIQLLQDEKESVCHVPPFKPSAGDVYVFSPLKEEESGN